ncbi:DUF3106 domain-containing protein, partial [Bacilli bacterium]
AWTVAQNTQTVAPAATPASPPVASPANAGAAATPAAPAAAASAATTAGTSHPAKSATKTAARKSESKLAWANLSQAQHEALEPLTGEWPRMSELQKEKWLEIGKRYAKMKPEE